MIRHVVVIFWILAASASSLAANDPPEDKFRRLTVNEGLSQNSVFRIIQDRHGFIWIGTQDGLNRYDGYEFKVYKHDPDDQNSLSENTITALFEDSEGMLWIGTEKQGLNRFDPERGNFEQYLTDPDDPESIPDGVVLSIGEDSRGSIWVGTENGLARLEDDSNLFTRYENDAERRRSIGSGPVTSILRDRNQDMWIGTWEGGVGRYDAESDDFEVFDYDPVNQASLPDSRVTSLLEDRSGTMWVGTLGGLARFNAQSKTFESYGHDEDDANTLSGDQVSSLALDESGNLWVGTWDSGLNRFDPVTEQVERFRHDPDDESTIGGNRIISLIEDRSGVVWAGTNLSGVSLHDRHLTSFEHLYHDPNDENSLGDNTIWSIHESSENVVWIGSTDGGVTRYNRKSETFTRVLTGNEGAYGIKGAVVRSIAEDDNGDLWLATNAGVEVYRPDEGVVEHYPPLEDDAAEVPAGLTSNFISSVIRDGKGRLWVGGNRGIDRFDPQTKRFTTLYQGEEAEEIEGATNVLVLKEDSQGNLWAGTRAGVARFDLTAGSVERFSHDPSNPASISHNVVYAIHEDALGNMWFGTFGGGLNRLNLDTGIFTRWTEQNSALPTNTVFGVVGDDAGYLWLSTHRGIARFDPVTETFRMFDRHHGIQSPEFNSGAFHRGAYSGDLYFGGINGVNIVQPASMIENPSAPDVLITGVSLQQENRPGENDWEPTSTAARETEVRLDYDENDLWFDYVGLHYALPQQIEYAYMLENYDDTWRYVGDTRRASYTNLDPGSYRFRVKAASMDGVWNDEGATVELTIDPPWWQTTVAYVSYLALFVLGIFFVDTIQRRRVIKQERERGAMREARLRAKALEIENERQTRELEEARELQLSMLPRSVPDHPVVELEAYMKTATEVGGDYYDFHVADDETLTVAIGDATDHGARAGIMVTAVKGLFNILVEEDELELVLDRATNALKRMHLDRLYMALAIVKIKGESMRLAGAGMPPALLFRNTTKQVEDLSLSGMPLGSLVEYPYEVIETGLNPGDTVLLMSDGFAERFAPDGEMFGYDRVRESFAKVADLSPQEIIDNLVKTSHAWAGNDAPSDDMTFVVIKAKTDIPARNTS